MQSEAYPVLELLQILGNIILECIWILWELLQRFSKKTKKRVCTHRSCRHPPHGDQSKLSEKYVAEGM